MVDDEGKAFGGGVESRRPSQGECAREYEMAMSYVIERIGVPYGSRTRVAAVKGRCPGPLDERDVTGGRTKLLYALRSVKSVRQ